MWVPKFLQNCHTVAKHTKRTRSLRLAMSVDWGKAEETHNSSRKLDRRGACGLTAAHRHALRNRALYLHQVVMVRSIS